MHKRSKGSVDDAQKKAYNASMQTGQSNDQFDAEGSADSHDPETIQADSDIGAGKQFSNLSSDSTPLTAQKRQKISRVKNNGHKKLIVMATIAITLAGIIAFAILAFPRLDAYLLDRAETVAEEQARIAAELAEDGFEPIAERVIEDVRSNIYRPRSSGGGNQAGGGSTSDNQTGTASSQTDVVVSSGAGSSASADIDQTISATSENSVVVSGDTSDLGDESQDSASEELELDPFGLLFLMREAVIAYDDAGEFAREGRYNTAYSYLVEAEMLFRELIAIIDEGIHTLDGDDKRGAEQLRRSAEYFLIATGGAKQFVQGIEPEVDIAAEDARARAELREARTLLES